MRNRLLYPFVAFVTVFVFHLIYSVWEVTEISKQWVQIKEITPLAQYLQNQQYFLSFSYALASAFTTYALVSFLQNRKRGVVGVVGSATVTGFLYFAGCFLLGCCGSPMLVVYMSLFGSSFLGVTKPLTATLTLASAIIGYFWMERKTKKIACCVDDELCNERLTARKEAVIMHNNTATNKEALDAIQFELSSGMELPKCRKCGCMKETLESLQSALPALKMKPASALSDRIKEWHIQMESIKYACLGCEYCFPAVAMNIYNETFSAASPAKQLGCSFEMNYEMWPPVAGEYFPFCKGTDCPVAVSTLGSVQLADKLAEIRPKELCIVGKTETENIGIEKVIKNTITNPTIHFLLLAGKEPKGHESGNTFLALSRNGVDESMRVIGSTGKRPFLRNVTRDEVETFRRQVQIIDMIGCEDETSIVEKLKQIAQSSKLSCGCQTCTDEAASIRISNVPLIEAKEPAKVEMDKAGYFVILPQADKRTIIVEHYSYDNTLLRIIEGKDARSIYWTIIENKFVTQLSHAAYLGKELEKAELSMKFGFKYVQDEA